MYVRVRAGSISGKQLYHGQPCSASVVVAGWVSSSVVVRVTYPVVDQATCPAVVAVDWVTSSSEAQAMNALVVESIARKIVDDGSSLVAEGIVVGVLNPDTEVEDCRRRLDRKCPVVGEEAPHASRQRPSVLGTAILVSQSTTGTCHYAGNRLIAD